MRHDWRTTRRLEPHPDGQRRWDRAYQLLLEWAATGPAPGRPLASRSRVVDPHAGGASMRIAIYVRVSTQRQAQTQTIDQQIDRLRTHVRGPGLATARGERLP